MGTGHAPPDILRALAEAVREEFALTACIIKLDHGVPAVIAADDPVAASALKRLDARDVLDAAAIAAEMPPEAWLVGQPIDAASGAGGVMLLAGQPPASFRPDAAVVVALADLVGNEMTERATPSAGTRIAHAA